MKYPAIDLMFKEENPQSVFEVGCAAGHLMEEIGNDCIKGGLELDPVSIVREFYPQYADNFIQWNAAKVPWPIPDNSYDIVFTCGLLIYIPDPFPVIREMLRIAKDKIILAEIHSESEDEYGFLGKNSPLPPVYDQVRIARNYKKVFEILGLKADYVGNIASKDIFKCKKTLSNR